MKKFLTLLMAVSFIGLIGCGDDPVNGGGSGSGDGGGDVTPDPKPVVPSTLTPGEHQKKLEDIAKEFVSYFDADDHKQIVEAVTALGSYAEEDANDVAVGYSHAVSVGIDGNGFTQLYGLFEGSNPRIIEKPGFVTSATLSMNNGYYYELDVKADLSKMSLNSGAIEGVIVIAADNNRRMEVAVFYDKQFYEWGAYLTIYCDHEGKGRMEITSPYLRSHISEITLKAYAKDGYFSDMHLSAIDNGVVLDITVNRSVAIPDKGRIEFHIGGIAVYAVDAMCETRSAASLLSKTGLLSLLRGVASCSEGGVAEAVTRASAPDYSYSLNEYKGTAYTYDNDKEEWIESVIDGDKVSLAWDDAQIIVSWINSNKKWTGKVDFDQTAEIYVPQQIKVQMTVAGKEQLALTVTPDLTDNYNVAVKAVCTINGGYALSVDAKADRKGAQASVVLAKGDKKLSTARGSMSVNDATDPDNWFEQDGYTWTDSYGIEHTEKWTYCVLDEYLEDNIKTGEISVDILAASIYAKGDLRKIISGAKAIENTESKDGAVLLSALINANAESYLYYNDTGEKVADVIAQPYLSDYWNYESPDYNYSGTRAYDEEYWDQEPILVFPDGSKFAFEDYFTSNKFSSLIDAVEALLDAYVKIVENE